MMAAGGAGKMDAYDLEKVQSFKKLGMTVEAITAYDDVLLVAVKGGNMWQYNIALRFDPVGKRQKVQLQLNANKSFSAKPVTKMTAIKECSLLVVIADHMCHVYDLDTFELKSSLPSTKGVSDFTMYVKEELDDNKKIQVNTTVKMAVAIGKKLKVLQWNGETFEEVVQELVLGKSVKALMWCQDIVFVAFADEYFALKPASGEVHDVFSLGGGHQEPLMTSLPGDELLLGHHNQSVFINSRGKAARDTSITWSAIPHFVLYDSPYAVAVLDKYVEVRSIDPVVSIQRLDVKRVEAVCQSSKLIFLLTLHNVHMLIPRPDSEQARQLLHNNHYELTIQIYNQSKLPAGDKAEEIARIKAQWAVHLFCLHKFADAMNMFLQLTTDPYHVIGVLPDYLPAMYSNSLVYPEKVPLLHGDHLKQATGALMHYLTQKRREIAEQEPLLPFTPVMMHHKKNDTLKTRDQALSVIDTTLLKCYLQCNVSLVAPLLRQEDNHVNVREAHKVLLRDEHFSELIILYERNNQHEEALEMMKSEAHKRKSTLAGTDMTVHYLQKLGVEHLQLIFKYAEWVFEDSSYEGLKIFTENDPVVKSLPRGHVLSFIEKYSQETAIVYLEHVIYQWHGETGELHMALANHLREQVMNCYTEYVRPKSGVAVVPGEEPGRLGVYRGKLLRFLRASHSYKPDIVLTSFPLDCLYDERAILLGRMKRHREALGIYVYILHDLAQAERYCDQEHKDGEHVYLYLLKTYLHPPDPRELGVSQYESTPQPNLLEALSILEQHADKIDLCQALDILPDDLQVKKLRSYLEVALEIRVSHKNLCQVRRRVQYEELLQVSRERLLYNLAPIKLVEETGCTKCNKKIGKSFFAYYSDGTIMHYGCSKVHSRSPSTASQSSTGSQSSQMSMP